ncbi:hypothetical protein Cgig2_026192 [Carnegiea gigantea]|uniref:Uncharacterized protein n=1 Tax=Carnegiea gigantea TaxID=171969 RepID=A0A9Q1GQ03_9CARY|nr:hypothetical protein Cgig2_026192 [Carnegiea gigantea]
MNDSSSWKTRGSIKISRRSGSVQSKNRETIVRINGTILNPVEEQGKQVEDQTMDESHQVEQVMPMIKEQMMAIEATQKVSSYTSLVDSEEESSLKYVPLMSINGMNCAKLEGKDVEEEIRYWNSTLLCYVLGSNLPFEVIDRCEQRRSSWDNIRILGGYMQEAWNVIGDFNAILSHKDRIGGTKVLDKEIEEFQQCTEATSLTEMRSFGSYFTWTNKQVEYLPMGLSDHTPMLLQSPNCPKPTNTFRFCDMWIKDPEFVNQVRNAKTKSYSRSKMAILFMCLKQLKHQLKKLNRDRFHDIHNQ